MGWPEPGARARGSVFDPQRTFGSRAFRAAVVLASRPAGAAHGGRQRAGSPMSFCPGRGRLASQNLWPRPWATIPSPSVQEEVTSHGRKSRHARARHDPPQRGVARMRSLRLPRGAGSRRNPLPELPPPGGLVPRGVTGLRKDPPTMNSNLSPDDIEPTGADLAAIEAEW